MEALYNQCKDRSSPPNGVLLRDTLLVMLHRTPNTFILLDGLDECLQFEREKILKLIEDIMREAELAAHILITSRKEKDITDSMRNLCATSMSITGHDITSDINLHIRESLSNDIRLREFPQEVKDNIEHVLTEKANGM